MSILESAARAHYDHEPVEYGGRPVAWEKLHEHVREYHRAKARAVLIALQSAMLPQWSKMLDYVEMSGQLAVARRHYTDGPGVDHAHQRQLTACQAEGE